MINAPELWPIEEYKDIGAINYCKEAKSLFDQFPDQKPSRLDIVTNGLRILGRDHSRPPMQWDSSQHAGFSTGKPWIRIHDLYPEINVERKPGGPGSVPSFWKRMIRLRKEYVYLFVYGDFELVNTETENSFVFTNCSWNGKKKVLIALNFSKTAQPFLLMPQKVNWELVLGNVAKRSEDTLALFERRIYLSRE